MDGGGMVADEVLIGLGEMSASVETSIYGKWAGMGGGEHEVLASVDKRTFALRITAPKHEDKVFALLAQGSDSSICKLFPPFVLVASGSMCFHREGGI